MGLFAFLRRLLGRRSHRPQPGNTAPPAIDHIEAISAQNGEQTVRNRVPKLVPLRYESSLVRTPASAERVAERPYRFAHLAVDGSGYLNLATDFDPRWLDHFGLPLLQTPEEVAQFFDLPLGKLAWLTHRFDEGGRPGNVKSAHYHYRWIKKRAGGHRLIEAPKSALKAVQHTILTEILSKIPPHPAAHGFVRHRSILTNATPHVRQAVILKFDLQNFYASVRYSRVTAIFRSVGYSREVSLWLARLTTSAIPASLTFPAGDPAALLTFYPRHLPQGAPTSPALANLSAYSLDVRLSGLARAYGARYTRYADDLTFSGPGKMGGALSELIPLITQIIKSERFSVRREKRKVMRQHQRQTVTGVVVNSKTNVTRAEFDRLKAILNNCVRHGPASQNHESHEHFADYLAGRISHVRHLNANRGEKLWQLFRQIEWAK